VDSLEGEEPWCLLIYHKAPHRNWQPDEAHAGLHSDPIPLPATFEDDYATRSSAAHMAALRVVDHLTTNDFKVDPPPDLSRGSSRAGSTSGTWRTTSTASPRSTTAWAG